MASYYYNSSSMEEERVIAVRFVSFHLIRGFLWQSSKFEGKISVTYCVVDELSFEGDASAIFNKEFSKVFIFSRRHIRYPIHRVPEGLAFFPFPSGA